MKNLRNSLFMIRNNTFGRKENILITENIPEVTLQLYSVGKKFYEVYFVGEDNEITQIKEVELEEVIKFYGDKDL